MSVEQHGLLRRGTASRTSRSFTQVAALRYEVAGLRLALDTRAPIEQAKGMLMMRYGFSEDEAFHMLTRWSSERNVKLRAVALTLIGIFTGDDSVVDPAVDPYHLLHQVISGLDERATSTRELVRGHDSDSPTSEQDC